MYGDSNGGETTLREYRVWRRIKRKKDQRGTQGHYVMAHSRNAAVMKVKRKSEKKSDMDAVLWKNKAGKLTKFAKHLQKYGTKAPRRRKKKRRRRR